MPCMMAIGQAASPMTFAASGRRAAAILASTYLDARQRLGRTRNAPCRLGNARNAIEWKRWENILPFLITQKHGIETGRGADVRHDDAARDGAKSRPKIEMSCNSHCRIGQACYSPAMF